LEGTRHVGIAKSEHPKLTNGEIISAEFQPMWSQFTNVTDGQRDGQTDDVRSQYRCLHYSASRGKNVRHKQSPSYQKIAQGRCPDTGWGGYTPRYITSRIFNVA